MQQMAMRMLPQPRSSGVGLLIEPLELCESTMGVDLLDVLDIEMPGQGRCLGGPSQGDKAVVEEAALGDDARTADTRGIFEAVEDEPPYTCVSEGLLDLLRLVGVVVSPAHRIIGLRRLGSGRCAGTGRRIERSFAITAALMTADLVVAAVPGTDVTISRLLPLLLHPEVVHVRRPTW